MHVCSVEYTLSPHPAPSLSLPPYVECHPLSDQSICRLSRKAVCGSLQTNAPLSGQTEQVSETEIQRESTD